MILTWFFWLPSHTRLIFLRHDGVVKNHAHVSWTIFVVRVGVRVLVQVGVVAQVLIEAAHVREAVHVALAGLPVGRHLLQTRACARDGLRQPLQQGDVLFLPGEPVGAVLLQRRGLLAIANGDGGGARDPDSCFVFRLESSSSKEEEEEEEDSWYLPELFPGPPPLPSLENGLRFRAVLLGVVGSLVVLFCWCNCKLISALSISRRLFSKALIALA